MKKLVLWVLILALSLPSSFGVLAAEKPAVDLSGNCTVSLSSGASTQKFSDGNYNTYATVSSGDVLTIVSEKAIFSLYLVFDRTPSAWTLTDLETGETVSCGKNGFLHEFVDVKTLFGTGAKRLSLEFSTNASLADVYAYSEGKLPDDVQTWESADAPCDLLLLSTHSDDDQLFFAGLLPTYAARGMEVQVAYFVHHLDTHNRPHELLNGLWHTGMKRYPIISDFPDAYSESVEGAQYNMESAGFSREAVVQWQTNLLRRVKPIVVVGHDIEGEYGHGQHMYNTATLMEAIHLASDSTYDAEGVKEYGTWEILRCYLHLYPENRVVCDFDVPLDFFGGKTAFEVSKEAFGFHHSQQWTWFADWVDKPTASAITQYSPCEYGLYYNAKDSFSTSSDFFEGLKTHAQVAEEDRIALEQAEEKWREDKEEELKESEEKLDELSQAAQEVEKEVGQLQVQYVLLCIGLALLVLLVAFHIVLKRKQARKKQIRRNGRQMRR